jgi:hypothetical protein
MGEIGEVAAQLHVGRDSREERGGRGRRGRRGEAGLEDKWVPCRSSGDGTGEQAGGDIFGCKRGYDCPSFPFQLSSSLPIAGGATQPAATGRLRGLPRRSRPRGVRTRTRTPGHFRGPRPALRARHHGRARQRRDRCPSECRRVLDGKKRPDNVRAQLRDGHRGEGRVHDHFEIHIHGHEPGEGCCPGDGGRPRTEPGPSSSRRASLCRTRSASRCPRPRTRPPQPRNRGGRL